MKPWVEWLLSIALLLLVVTVIVALVIGLVKWFRPQKVADDVELQFDLGSPKLSTIWKRRQQWTLVDRKYSGSAGVGDFFRITVHPQTRTIDYHNLSTSQQGVAPYTVKSDGLYEIADPAHVLCDGLEVPGYGLLLAAEHGGPKLDQSSIVIAFAHHPIVAHSIPTGTFGFMHFLPQLHTTRHGLITSRPSAKQGHHEFQHIELTELAEIAPEGEGEYLTASTKGERVYLFASPNGAMALDLPDGSLVLLPQPPSHDFPFPIRSRYQCILSCCHSTDKTTMIEPILDVTPVNGNATLTDRDGTVFFSGTLTADQQCKGAFTLSMSNPIVQCTVHFFDKWCLLTAVSPTFVLNGAALLK